ncbi:MAG: hypothetical protein R2744_11985 [Bacteroidales bacterium]
MNLTREQGKLVNLAPDEADGLRFNVFITPENVEPISAEFTLAHSHIS